MNCLLCQNSKPSRYTFLELVSGHKGTTDLVCLECLSKFEKIHENICQSCGRDLEEDEGDNADKLNLIDDCCVDCQHWQSNGHQSVQHRALYRYNKMMKEYMARYKFSGDFRLYRIFQSEMKQAIQKRCRFEKIDVVIPIPLSQERLHDRGFNQVQPWLPKKSLPALTIRKDKKTQSSMGRKGRMEAPQPFTIQDKWHKQLSGKTILLIDDVYTTGRTIYHAATCCYDAGAKKVYSQSLAR